MSTPMAQRMQDDDHRERVDELLDTFEHYSMVELYKKCGGGTQAERDAAKIVINSRFADAITFPKHSE